MGTIQLLPPHEAQKIAAGEVVDRPANVVKELIENSLDAGASSLILKFCDGGKTSLSIIDNGCGMSEDDARMAIQNHATSKLRNVDDIPSITTFGFRGEALASIAAVSRMTITTKTAADAQGIQLIIEGGTIISETSVACNTGTAIDVQNIFYNLPARKKFLKKDETEWNVIYHMIQALSLAHCSCSFTVYHNDHQTLHAPAVATVQERCAQLFDSAFAANSIPCSTHHQAHDVSISGVITHPTYHRYDRNYLFFFVNNRWVKNNKLGQAFIKAYASMLPERRYPAGVIFINVDPEEVDINIHPRKEEVQFLHPRIVEDAVERLIHGALQTQTARDLGLPPRLTFATAPQRQHATALSPHTSPTATAASAFKQPAAPAWQFGRIKDIPQPHVIAPQTTLGSPEQPATFTAHAGTQQVISTTSGPTDEQPEYRLIGQVLDTYIIIETKDGIVMIDQHAAHEAVLYEQFEQRCRAAATTQLMFPQLITLEPADAATLTPWLALFEDHGIELHQLNDRQFVVKATPVNVKEGNIEELMKATVGWINEGSGAPGTEFLKALHDKLRAMMACKAAVKAGDVLDERQMHGLIDKMHATQHSMTCPHGRPTTWKISLSEIERKFKRSE